MWSSAEVTESQSARRLSVGPGKMDSVPKDPLQVFSPATATWFREVFAHPTAAQNGAWQAISGG